MDSFPTRLAIALMFGASVFFLMQALMSAVTRSRMPRVVQIQAMLAENERRATRPTIEQRLRHWAAGRGYTGTLGPVVLALSLVYLVVGTLLVAVGLPSLVAIVLALPASWLLVSAVGGVLAAKRKALFDRQLLDGLVMLAGQIESGTGVQRALRQVQMASPSPLKEELGFALQQAEATRNVVGPMEQLAKRYPSRAFELFIAALRIDEELGGRIEPSLKEAASIMQRDFALIEEAQAEIAQAKVEFYGILVVIGFITFTIISSADPVTKELMFSPLGLVVLAALAGWVGIGVAISLNMMSGISGRKPSKLGRKRPANSQEVTS